MFHGPTSGQLRVSSRVQDRYSGEQVIVGFGGLRPEYFRREDEGDDGLFYAEPRLVVHIDEHAIAALGEYFARVLPQNGVILDLMSSWRSHLPEALPIRKLVGLGLNSTEMAENPQLDESMVHDLNSDPALPFEDRSFDAALVTVSIQYMIRPVEVFNQVNRVLREGAKFHVIYSNRMFSAKAVWIWRALDDVRRAQLVGSYFTQSDGWEAIQVADISPKLDFDSDPLYAVSARKMGARTE